MKTKFQHHAYLASAALAASLLLAGCGGEGSGAPSTGANTPPAETGSDAAVGSISGFGSIIVNGVRYDDSAASVVDDSGNSRPSSSLGLGMMVELKGKNSDDGTGSARSITVFSELQGPISNLSATAGTFSVLGFNVTTSASTVYADVAGLSALADGKTVEVYGLRNGNTIAASRIELKTPGVGDVLIKVRGPIANLNSATSSFTVGTATINYAGAVITPTGAALTNGTFVKINSSSVGSGNTFSANRVHVIGARAFGLEQGAKSELEGVVSGFVSTSQFVIGGVTVDASSATVLRGTTAAIVNGARLQVKGILNSSNVLVARLVKFDDSTGIDSFKLHGAVSDFTSLAKFVVRGVTVDASASTVLFERGLASAVANGRRIEVEGTLQTSASGSVLKASKVKFEDSPVAGVNGGAEFEFKGRVTSVSGNILVVGTRTVTVSSATVYRKITQAQIVNGAFLEIKGALQADGSVTAVRISLED